MSYGQKIPIGQVGMTIYVRLLDRVVENGRVLYRAIDPTGKTITAEVDAPDGHTIADITMEPSEHATLTPANGYAQYKMPAGFEGTTAGTLWLWPKVQEGSDIFPGLQKLAIRVEAVG